MEHLLDQGESSLEGPYQLPERPDGKEDFHHLPEPEVKPPVGKALVPQQFLFRQVRTRKMNLAREEPGIVKELVRVLQVAGGLQLPVHLRTGERQEEGKVSDRRVGLDREIDRLLDALPRILRKTDHKES